MSVISETMRITDTDAVTIFTAATDCTVSLDITNDAEDEATVRVVYTPTPAVADSGHVVESRTLLAPNGGLSRNGLPVKSGWSFVLTATGKTVNLSALVSGFTVEK